MKVHVMIFGFAVLISGFVSCVNSSDKNRLTSIEGHFDCDDNSLRNVESNFDYYYSDSTGNYFVAFNPDFYPNNQMSLSVLKQIENKLFSPFFPEKLTQGIYLCFLKLEVGDTKEIIYSDHVFLDYSF